MAARILTWLLYAAVLLHCVNYVNATKCPPGSYLSGSTSALCPPGTYQDQSDASSCKNAQAGWYATGPGATQQTICPQGYYSTGLAAQCTICPAGSHCNGSGNTSPQLCEPGRYSSQSGAGQDCAQCPAGTFSSVSGATSCCSCCSGWYTDQVGQTHCFNCPNRESFQQGYSPIGATSADQCIAVPGAVSSCTMSGNSCPATGGSMTSGTAQKRAQKLTAVPKRCSRDYESCPVYGFVRGMGYGRVYECVDTQNDLESCGGCVDDDSPFGERGMSGGRDCTAIPNVDNVRCARGTCVIEQCHHGYAVTRDGQKCRPVFNSWNR